MARRRFWSKVENNEDIAALPGIPGTFWSFKYALKIRKKASLLPLGLLTVAAMLPEDWVKRLGGRRRAEAGKKDLAWDEYHP